MSGLIGKKIGMTSIFDESGKNLPCTVIQAGPCVVTQIKSKSSDGYNSVQLGFNEKNEKHTNNAEIGHFKRSKSNPTQNLIEFKGFDEELKIGDKLTVDHFEEGEFVDVSGNSKPTQLRLKTDPIPKPAPPHFDIKHNLHSQTNTAPNPKQSQTDSKPTHMQTRINLKAGS